MRQVRRYVGLALAAYDAAELPHHFGWQCARDVIAVVGILVPVVRYDVDVEMSCKASFPGRRSDKMTYTESRPRGNN